MLGFEKKEGVEPTSQAGSLPLYLPFMSVWRALPVPGGFSSLRLRLRVKSRDLPITPQGSLL